MEFLPFDIIEIILDFSLDSIEENIVSLERFYYVMITYIGADRLHDMHMFHMNQNHNLIEYMNNKIILDLAILLLNPKIKKWCIV